jgi:two-component system LytT family sensor kinase
MKKRLLLNWALPVAVWLAAALIGTTFSYDFRVHIGRPMAWLEVARVYFVAYFIWGAIFTPIVVWLCKRFVIEKRNWSSMMGLHVLFSIVVAGCNALIRAPLHRFVYPSEPQHTHSDLFRNYFLANAYDDMWMYWVVAAIAFGFMYYRKYKEREVQAVQLEAQLTRARLEMLKMQLQPHFLFNTLHSVSALMRKDVDGAERVIAQLSDLLRISLESADQQEITLKKELEFLEGYLDIEQTRFRDRLKVEYYIDSDCLDACVPNMLLQPIVENAVRHGIAPHSKPGVIEISARREGHSLRMSVTDNGKGMGADGPKRKGLGLANTRERLQQHFPGRYKLELVDVPTGGLAVNVLIPFSTEQATNSEPNLVTNYIADRPIAQQSAVGNIYDHTSLDRG